MAHRAERAMIVKTAKNGFSGWNRPTASSSVSRWNAHDHPHAGYDRPSSRDTRYGIAIFSP